MRRFAGLRLSESLPDEITILNFRRFLERHKLGRKLFDEINQHLGEHGLMMREGGIVDASIISEPSSTKNREGKRDPEMHQTRKGNQWFFGMKMHVGVDDLTGLVHSLETTPANVHDLEIVDRLLHGKEVRVFGDAGYRGIDKREDHKDRELAWYIAERPGRRRQLDPDSQAARAEKLKSQIRAKVEHPFRYIKRMFGYDKVRYRGQAKNRNRLQMLVGFTNLLLAEKFMPT